MVKQVTRCFLITLQKSRGTTLQQRYSTVEKAGLTFCDVFFRTLCLWCRSWDVEHEVARSVFANVCRDVLNGRDRYFPADSTNSKRNVSRRTSSNLEALNIFGLSHVPAELGQTREIASVCRFREYDVTVDLLQPGRKVFWGKSGIEDIHGGSEASVDIVPAGVTNRKAVSE